MCGIVGYVGPRSASNIIFNGLKKLEYRGYDSAGIATIAQNGHIEIRREVGKLHNLEGLLDSAPLAGQVGIGHTRWATHGEPSVRNAHPHIGMNGRVVVVQNGIVENFLSLREELLAEGIEFQSDTDTEVIVQMIERYLESGIDFETAVRQTATQLEGANAIVVMTTEEPNRLICARLGNAGGITVGIGHGEMFIASDLPAILEHTRQMIFLENRQMAVITNESYQLKDLNGNELNPEISHINWDPVSAAKGEYKHFMQKEIYDQPQAIIDTMRGRVNFEKGTISLPEMNLTEELVHSLNKIFIVACGTSYYAGLIGKFMIESIARMPVEVEYGSEFRYYDPILDEKTAVLAITQSGETADTLVACEQAKAKGATLWAIVNAIGSQATRISDGLILMHAGPEIGVASTKAFTTSLVNLFMLACELGRLRGTVSTEQIQQYVNDLAHLPNQAGQLLENEALYEQLANIFHRAQGFLFLGRGINYPIALEGALKLKEISYIHAEGYPAGEMKHGPIALIDETMPVVTIATSDSLYEKMLSNIQQVKTRGGNVIAVASQQNNQILTDADHVIHVPQTNQLLQPILNSFPHAIIKLYNCCPSGL